MTKEELKQEAEKWLRKFLLCNDCKRKCHCIELNAYCEEQVLKAYIDSAAPREKHIAELEKKNTALRQEWEIMKNTISEYNDFCDKYISLEKENAELKHIIATLRQEKDNVSMHAKAMEVVAKTRSDQLIKAKEIIKGLLSFVDSLGNYSGGIFARAEQFLKGE